MIRLLFAIQKPTASIAVPPVVTVALRQFQGKVILLDFWATWCGPCKEEMPGYEDLYRRYKSRGLVVVGIALDASPAQVRRFGKKYGITYPLLINGMNVDRYHVLGIPTTILADRQGIVGRKVVGCEEGKVFEDVLKELLAPRIAARSPLPQHTAYSENGMPDSGRDQTVCPDDNGKQRPPKRGCSFGNTI